MSIVDIENLAIDIVRQSCESKNKYTAEIDAPVNYACIFSHSKDEFETLKNITSKIGTIIKETTAGPIFHVNPINTISGKLKLLKIRIPQKDKPGLGYADFTVDDYENFKNKYITQKNFKLIKREDYEIIGIIDKESGAGTYFAYPPLDKQLGIN